MSTGFIDRESAHFRSVSVTTLTVMAGVAAALLSSALTADAASPSAAATSTFGLVPLAAFVAIQYPILRLLGVDVADFSKKDHLYVLFMTFSMWFVSWTILLTSGATVQLP